jgi:hypothetical protein
MNVQNKTEKFLNNFLNNLILINEYSNKIFQLSSSILINLEKISLIFEKIQNNSDNNLISNLNLNYKNDINNSFYVPPSKILYEQFLNKKKLYKGGKYFKIHYTRKSK